MFWRLSVYICVVVRWTGTSDCLRITSGQLVFWLPYAISLMQVNLSESLSLQLDSNQCNHSVVICFCSDIPVAHAHRSLWYIHWLFPVPQLSITPLTIPSGFTKTQRGLPQTRALCFLMKPDRIFWGHDGWWHVCELSYSSHLFSELWNWSNHSGGYFNWVVFAVIIP